MEKPRLWHCDCLLNLFKMNVDDHQPGIYLNTATVPTSVLELFVEDSDN